MTTPSDSTEQTGVLLVNLGTPDAPTPKAVRRYLKQFLWDPRVVDLSRPVWWLILNGIVLRLRPKRSAALYQKVWTEEGSPLLVTSQNQRRWVEAGLAEKTGGPVKVALGMRYGTPNLTDGLSGLVRAGCTKVVVLPLFPQHSISTTGSVEAAIIEAQDTMADPPETDVIPFYFDHPGYIAALAASVRESWKKEGTPDRLMMSFHGTPKRYRNQKGDRYFGQCGATAHKLAEALNLPDDKWLLCFQSRFGWEEWLTPYTDGTLKKWGREGIKNVDIICPGFAADCLETLEEIAITNAKLFEAAGGKKLRYIPALNDRADHMAALVDMLAERLSV